jgi:hypothetical protein
MHEACATLNEFPNATLRSSAARALSIGALVIRNSLRDGVAVRHSTPHEARLLAWFKPGLFSVPWAPLLRPCAQACRKTRGITGKRTGKNVRNGAFPGARAPFFEARRRRPWIATPKGARLSLGGDRLPWARDPETERHFSHSVTRNVICESVRSDDWADDAAHVGKPAQGATASHSFGRG